MYPIIWTRHLLSTGGYSGKYALLLIQVQIQLYHTMIPLVGCEFEFTMQILLNYCFLLLNRSSTQGCSWTEAILYPTSTLTAVTSDRNLP